MKSKVIDIDKGYKNLVKFFEQHPASVEIGIFENKKGEEGESIAEYAATNEFGKGRTHERSFMRSAYDENIKRIVDKLNKLAAKGLLTDGNIKNILGVCGEDMRNMIVMKIRNAKSWARGLSLYTVAMKGHDTILIDSGNMWKAIDIRSK